MVIVVLAPEGGHLLQLVVDLGEGGRGRGW